MLSNPSLSSRKLVYRGAIDTNAWELRHQFNKRFTLHAKAGKIAFIDSHWPTLYIFDDPGINNFTKKKLKRLFYWGFCPPVTEFIPHHFAPKKYFPTQQNFWQYPCRTEQEAYERHILVQEPIFGKRTAHTYIGLPWATWIDKESIPTDLLQLYGERLASIRSFLAESGVNLHAHTVCQHVDWKLNRNLKNFMLAGINQLWIAHKEKGWDKERKLRLHSWPLYAVNAQDPERRAGLEVVPVKDKAIFASFKGAHMDNYPSNVRLRLKALESKKGYQISVNNQWHFDDIVYGYQAGNKKMVGSELEARETFTYNKLLSKTLFSLCPRGAGPNTLRLWESLASGSIPVVLSDEYEFPNLERMGCASTSWSEAVVEIAEKDVAQLDERLRALTQEQCQRMQSMALELFAKSKEMRCFGG